MPQKKKEIERLNKITKIDKCPKCGKKDGYYENRTMSIEQHYRWDGSPIHYGCKKVWGGKRKYCLYCGKDVTKYFKE